MPRHSLTRFCENSPHIGNVSLPDTLDNCEVVDDDSISLDEVGLGSTIKLKNFQSGKVETWQIVSSNEANFAEHKISDDSPIGKAALKKKVGETFQVFAPVGTLLFEVLEIGK